MKYALIALALSLTACGQPLYYRPYQPIQAASNPFYIDPNLIVRPPANAPMRSTMCQSYMVGTTMQTNCN